jgi:hypothetical protein
VVKVVFRAGRTPCFKTLELIKTTFDLATNLTPIIQGVVDIMPVFLDLVIAMVPVVITLAVVSFLLGFFDKILGMIKF